MVSPGPPLTDPNWPSRTPNEGPKKLWNDDEDVKILELVQMHGAKNWPLIAEHLPGRVGKQCRER